jgi:hypothetical protein
MLTIEQFDNWLFNNPGISHNGDAPIVGDDTRTLCGGRHAPYAGLSDFLAADFKRWRDEIRREDESIQYGKLSDRVKRQERKYRIANSKTKGIKALNPFMARALASKKDK